MIPNPRRRCAVPDCKQVCTHGIHRPERCDAHKTDVDRDLVLHRCVVCNLPAVLDATKCCPGCTKRGTRVRLYRQRQVKHALEAEWRAHHPTALTSSTSSSSSFSSATPAQIQGTESNMCLPLADVYDRVAFPDGTSCGLERPDFTWNCGTHYVFLEVDERQHKDRLCECEQARMVNVTQGMGLPCLWVRFNPDEYTGPQSRWRERERLDYLVRYMRQLVCTPVPPAGPHETLRVVHLFFDDFDTRLLPTVTCIPTL